MSSTSWTVPKIDAAGEERINDVPAPAPLGLGAYLNLAPVISDTFPQSSKEPANNKGPTAPTAAALAKLASETAVVDESSNATTGSGSNERRFSEISTSSSASTVSEGAERRRFLKLAPVYWGGKVGTSDFAEVE